MVPVPEGYTRGVSPRRCCGVVAVAAAAGVPFDSAWAYLKAKQPKHRRERWAGATGRDLRATALRHFGVKFKEQTFKRRVTVAHFVEWHTLPGVLYMLTTGIHVTCVRDGMAMDQTGCAPVGEHRTRRLLVEHVVTIR